MRDLRDIVGEFAKRLTQVIEGSAIVKARDAVLAALGLGLPLPRRRGRPPKALGAASRPAAVRHRRKGPIQLCPVPGCKNRAAPIFGMVCSKHKDLSKATIKKYREARKLKKAKAAGKPVPAKRRAKPRARKLKKVARAKRAVPAKRKAKSVVRKPKKAIRAKKPVKKLAKPRKAIAASASTTSPSSSAPAPAAAAS
jgi:hypothetical protein